MILETLLSLTIQSTVPSIPVHQIIHSGILSPTPVFAAYSSSRSSFSSSRSSFSRSSFSRPSSSFSSRSSFSSPRTSSFSSSSPTFTSKPSTPSFNSSPIKAPIISKPVTSSPPSVVRITKQNEPSILSKTTSTSSPIRVKTEPRQNYSPRVVTRETYVNNYSDSGIMGNPWFWMYMMDNNRTSTQQQVAPTQVVVKDSSGESVKIPENQMIVRKYSYSPIREFLVFSLGGGLGILFGRRFA